MNSSSKVVIACLAGLLLLMVSTQPARLPAAILALPFLLLFIALSIVCVGTLRLQGLPAGKSLRLGLIGASLPMLALVLQSLGQLTVRDLATIVALFAIAYFYLSRLTRPTSG